MVISMDKPWEQVTSKEIMKNKRNLCIRCKYSSRFNTDDRNVSVMTCDYILLMKHSRGCSPINCKKFEPRLQKKRRQALRINFKGSGEVYDEEKAETIQSAKERDRQTG